MLDNGPLRDGCPKSTWLVLFLRSKVERTFVRPPLPAGGNMKRGFAFVMFALVLFLSCNTAHAQISAAEAQLNGSVRGQTGSLIPKASVTLRNVDTNQTYKTTSNSVGFYILTNVAPGNYELTAEIGRAHV